MNIVIRLSTNHKARYRYILIVNYVTSFNIHHQFTICLFVSFLSLVTTIVLIKISHLLLFLSSEFNASPFA